MSNSVLVIAEKPSVARDIAAVIGADKQTDGVLRGNGYIVTSARGHLVRLKEPQEYDERYNKWDLSDLPIVPVFAFVPIESAADVLERLTALMNSAEVSEIICATDAGREGECIFRYVYDYIGCTKPVKRLWISSLTAESIRNGFANLRPAADYDNMYAAGITRAKIDWLWGMNLTRLYTKHLGAICSIGRVQTAVVNMIASRDNEIDGYKKVPYFTVKLANGAEWTHYPASRENAEEKDDYYSDRFAVRSMAEQIKAKCENQTCKLIFAKATPKKENRPLLFSLTSLQVEANDKLGFSAATTLTVMQSLYEKKLLTYPRTDSNYLTDDMAAILPERVAMLRAFDERADELLTEGLNIDGRIINNGKVSDHHAIIPTENIASAVNAELSANEKAILEMVIIRFLAALSAQYEYSETVCIYEIMGEHFKLKTKQPINLGWKKFYIEDEPNEREVTFAEGDTFTAKNIEIAECETQPPKRFTESTLLKAMENIDRRIEDKELSEYVSERGLGTPATRAAIIERVIKVGYVERKGKQLVSTDKGKTIISLLPDEVKSVEMTAAMELQLSAIENGTASADDVVRGINAKIRSIIALENGKKHTSLAPPREPLGKCPKCGGGVFKFTKDGKTVFYCENSPKTCFFRIYEDDYF
ncbi:MAG: DNA topoisomerase 3, partial [Lachnospiraceae bacterium]|nr:DNA topoisomerase 3 [Lachnospiraceae bacterium]